MFFRMRRCSAGGLKGKNAALEAAHRLIDRYHGVDGARAGSFPSTRRRRPRREARFLCPRFRAVRARMGLQARARAAVSFRRAQHAERSRSALRVADRRLSQRLCRPTKASANRTRTCISSRPCWRGSRPRGAKCFLPAPRELYGMMAGRFFQPQTGIFAEYFDGSWNPREGIAGRICEPGHHFEWSWLLRRYAGLSGRRDPPIAAALKEFGDRHGFDSEGFIVDELLDDGRVHKTSRRCWPHTEVDQGRGRRRRNRRPRGGSARGADDRSADCGFPWPSCRGRMDRPCRRERRSDGRFHAGEHALSCLSRRGGGRPCLGKAGKSQSQTADKQ